MCRCALGRWTLRQASSEIPDDTAQNRYKSKSHRRLSLDRSRHKIGSTQATSPDSRRRRSGKTLAYIWVRSMYRPLIGVNPTVKELFVDRTKSGPHFHDAFPDRHNAPVKIERGRLTLRLLVDRSIVEVYADGGETTITDRFFPAGKTLRWSAYARNGSATIRSLKAWQLGSTDATMK